MLIGVIDRLQGHRRGGLIEIIGSTIVGIVPVLDKRERPGFTRSKCMGEVQGDSR